MFWNKVKIVATVLLVAAVSTGASGLTYRVLADLGQRMPAAKSADKQPESLRLATQEIGRQPAPEQPPVAVDRYGDPLPERALLRLGTVRFRHPGSVCALALSPDGKSLATQGSSTVQLWDPTTGRPGPVLPCRREFIYGAGQNSLAFSPNGQELFYLDEQGVAARTLSTGQKQVLPPVGPNTKFHAVHPSPDGRLLAVGSNQGVQVLELASGRSRWSIQNGPDVRGSPDDRLLFHGSYSLGLFAQDGKSVAVNASDSPEILRLLEPASGEEQQRVELGARLVRLAFSRDGSKLATTERDNAVRVYDAATGRRLHSWTVKLTNPYENFTSAVAFSPDGATLAAGATDHLVHLWDLETGRELAPLRGHTWNVSGLVFAPDGRWLYSVGWDGAIRRWDTATWREKPVVPNAATGMVARSPVGSVLAWEGDGGVLHVADAATGRNIRTLPGNPAGYSRLAFSPDGSILAAGGSDLSVQLWEVASGKLLRQWSWPKGKDPHACVDDIVFAPDGKTLATAGFRTHEVLLWDVGTGARLSRIGHEMVFGVVFLPDGRTLVTAGWDRAIRWWNLPDLRPLDGVTLPERSKVGDASVDARLHAVRCSPDGRLLATINLGGAFDVWDATSHKLLHSFPATASQCNIAFSPDGQWLAAGGYHGEVALWEARTGQPVLKLAGHPARVMSVAFGPDGRTLLTGSDDSTGLVWDLRPKIEVQDDPIPALLWDALAGANASAAYRAVWQLADRPDRSVPFLKAELTPAKPIDGRRLRELLDDLDSSRCADREAASKELAAWGEAIEPDLRRELTQSPSAEKRHRLQTLLDGLTAGLSSDNVRQVRAVVVLKWANTQGARRLLGELARGAPEARLTQEAKTSLELLSRGALPAP